MVPEDGYVHESPQLSLKPSQHTEFFINVTVCTQCIRAEEDFQQNKDYAFNVVEMDSILFPM